MPSGSIDSKVNLLIKESLKLYKKAPPDIKTGIPILYFGDRRAYEKSPIRVVTVGLNPSWKEFPDNVDRFPAAEAANEDRKAIQLALNEYFEKSPYGSWFGCYEPVLNGIDASYYANAGRPNRAIHTDLMSPVATNESKRSLVSSQA